MRSVNPKEVGVIFRDYARKIHAKAVTSDPNFLRISVACGKVRLSSFLLSFFPSSLYSLFLPFPFSPLPSPSLPLFSVTSQTLPLSQIEQWLEHNYPSFIHISSQHGHTQVTLDPRDPRSRMVSLEKAFDAELAKKKRVEDLRNGLAVAAERGEVQPTSWMVVVASVMAAFAAIVMFSFTVVYFILQLSGEGNEDVLNLNWVFEKLGWVGGDL